MTAICPAHATTVDFDASIGGTGILVANLSVSGVYCQSCGYLSPVFIIQAGEYQPGTILNFGTVTLLPSPIGSDQYGDVGFGYDYFYQSTTGPLPPFEGGEGSGIEPNGSFTCNALDPGNSCQSQVDAAWAFAEANPITEPLTVTVGTDPLKIQFAWAFADFAPPTPLPAALPLFATGLGALGLSGWHRRRKRVSLGS